MSGEERAAYGCGLATLRQQYQSRYLPVPERALLAALLPPRTGSARALVAGGSELLRK